MSSSPTTYPPLEPGTVVAGLTVEAAGTVTWLWATFFVFGNAFAGFWLVLAFLNAHPEVKYKLHQLLVRFGLAKPHSRHARTLSSNGGGHPQQSVQLVEQQTAVAAGPGARPHNAPAGIEQTLSSPKTSTLQHLTSSARVSADGMASPLRSHRSRAIRPPEICLEQKAMSPRPSLTLSPSSAAAAGKAGGVFSPTASSLRPSIDKVGAAAAAADSSNVAADGTAAGDAAAGSEAAGSVAEGSSSSMGSEGSGAEPRVVRLEWRNLCYAVKSATGLQLIVQGIYGCANPGELQGLMGPSGAGKSTLMDLLSKRTDPTGGAAAEAAAQQQQQQQQQQHAKGVTSNRTSDATAMSSSDGGVGSPVVSADGSHVRVQLPHQESELLVNGSPLSRKAFMNMSAYVPQHDNLVPTMTSWEALSFYASIILPPSTSGEEKRRRIKEVLAMMGLAQHKDTLVGGMLSGGVQLRGLSGGERKRLAIACGVVAKPSLVFLDEPTSGLDSFAALNVVLFLKNMASQSSGTLIASLHQPRSAIWGQLDQITLLASGRLMYTGPTDGLTRWFKSLGYHYDPKEQGMASDWALDLVSLGFAKPQAGSKAAGQEGGSEEDHSHNTGSGALVGPQGSARFRGLASIGSGSLGLSGVGSRRHNQQQQQGSSSKCCMMSSKQELTDAAVAFLQNLRTLHPEWFVSPDDAAWGKGNSTAAGRLSPGSSSQSSGLAPIKVHRGVSQGSDGPTNAAADVDESPFLQQAAYDAAHPEQDLVLQQHHGQLQLTPPHVLEEGEDKEGVLHALYTGWRKYTALLWREALITTRNPADMGGRMMTFTYVSLLSGLVAYNTPGDADSIMSRISSCYAVLSFYLLMPFVFMSLFTSDKRFFAADTTARLYHPFQYYMAKVSITLPFNMIVAIVFHLVYYGMIGMRHGPKAMGMSCFISLLMGITAMQAVYCCGIVASSQDLAFVYAIAWTALNLLVNPYMALFNMYSLGWGFSWLRFFSPFNYAWQALVQIEMQGRGFDCNTSSGLRVLGLIPDLMPQDSSFNTVRNLISNLGRFSSPSNPGHCVASGDAIVEMYTSGISFGGIVGILFGYFFLFMSVTYFVVYRSSKRHGPSL